MTMSDTVTPEDIALYLAFREELTQLGDPSDFDDPMQKVMELAQSAKYKALTDKVDVSHAFAGNLMKGLCEHFEDASEERIMLQVAAAKMAAQAHGWNQTSLDYMAIGIMWTEKISPGTYSSREASVTQKAPDPAFEQDLVVVLEIMYTALIEALIVTPVWGGDGEFGGNEEFSKYVTIELQKKYGPEFTLDEAINKALEAAGDE